VLPMPPNIVLGTDTFGREPQNGVARFLAGLHAWSAERQLPLAVFSSGDHLEKYPGVHNLQGLTYSTPAFGKTGLYYPVEGRRRQMRRLVKKLDPDIIHIPTPGPVGMTALAIAERQKRLVAGIYHTDFPAFGQKMVHEALEQALRDGGGMRGAVKRAAP